MAIQSGKYLLDGVDMYDVYGFFAESGYNDFLKLPKLKEPYSHNWGDQNGVQYDLSNPVYETRTATLRGHIEADSLDDYWSKSTALFNALKASGKRKLYIDSLEQEFEVLYRENPVAENLTKPFKYSPKIYVLVELRFEILGGGSLEAGLGSYYFGPVSAFPTTWNQITALSNRAEGLGSVIDLNTGTTHTRFAVAIRTVKNISKGIDLNASNQTVDDLYTVRTASISNPSGVAYKVLGMTITLPYTVNHIHQITIQ